MSRILLVDDDQEVLDYCQLVLEGQGHEAVTYANPEHALQIVKKQPFDLCVIDVVMPEASGYDLIKSFHKLPGFQSPCVMLTRRKSPDDIKFAMKLGAVDYLIKPLDKETFIKKIEAALTKSIPPQEVRLLASSNTPNAQILVQANITNITERGVRIRTINSYPKGVRLNFSAPVFEEMGIQASSLAVSSCKPISGDPVFTHEIYISFVNVELEQLRRIRNWVADRLSSSPGAKAPKVQRKAS